MRTQLHLLAAASLLAVVPAALADIIYVGDTEGNVAQYDTVTNLVSPVGSVAADGGQDLGLAFDAAANRILILDRTVPQVYSMNPANGASVALFNPGFSFQGGAVAGNLLYGLDESTQTVEAFSLTTFADQNLSAGALAIHAHAMGVNPATGQLYSGGGGGTSPILLINPDGSVAGNAVIPDAATPFADDLDYYNSDFLVTDFGTNTLFLVDGTTGALSTFLTSAQLVQGGLTGGLSGVVVAPIPEPAGLSLLAAGSLFLGRRRR